MIKRLALTIATVVALLLAAGPASAKETWTSVRSQNFFLIGNAGDKEIRRVATRLEQFREVFSRLFPGAKFNSPVPTTVVVFKSHGSYKPFKPVVDGKISEVAGYFQSGEEINYITLTSEAGRENPFSTIYHEYVHLLVNNSYGNASVPAWFNEGLAEYYSTFDIDDDRKVQLGKLIDNHIYLLRQQQLIPLKTLFDIDYYSLHRNNQGARGLFYAEAWALVHYLILGSDGQRLPQLGRYFTLLSKSVPTEQAFREAFQTDYAGMEKELKKYVQSNTFRGQVATFERKLEFESELRSAPLTEAEAEAHLGDLLLHTDRAVDAAARLQNAITLDPKLAAAHVSLGLALARQKRFDDAKRHLRLALAADTQSYLANYQYAYALSREGMDESGMASGYSAEVAAEMRAALRKAMALKPEFPESYRLLAWVNLVTGEGLEESAELLKKALALSPGNEQYSFILAQIHLRRENYDAARRVAEPLAKAGGDPQMRANAQSLLRAIDTIQQQAAQYKAMREAAEKRNADGGVSTGGGGEAPRLRRRGETGNQPESNKSIEELQAEALAEAIHEAMRPAVEGETREQGVLLRIECGQQNLIFHVKVGERVLKLQTESFNNLHIMAFTPEAGGEITCGPRKTESMVVVTFRAATEARAKTNGAIVALEFVPASFRLLKK